MFDKLGVDCEYRKHFDDGYTEYPEAVDDDDMVIVKTGVMQTIGFALRKIGIHWVLVRVDLADNLI
jgi:hypothetical protein